MSLRAPIAVPIEIRADARRIFRLAWNLGEDGLRLAGELPFEPGRPIEAHFRLPDGEALTLRARVESDGGDEDDRDHPRELAFLDPPAEARLALRRYVQERLELPA
ncbi:MAG TPA: PilZ domain-containing protein [Polyangia bacterium]